MLFLSLFWLSPAGFVLISFLLTFSPFACGFTGSEYTLDTEYSGANFFDGWDFFTGSDPTGGFVTYYSRSSSQLKGLIQASDITPAYIGVDHENVLPITPAGLADGAGRPSVRISSQRSWTHGLFIGDFNHAPGGICGTWPAFWTLGPNWPYTGEIDILEGVNKLATNSMTLHTNETCVITSNATTQLGSLSSTNCAYYPDSNVGCGVVDPRPASYSQFNSLGGGVYAMQWTSEYIRVWFFPRDLIPQDIVDKQPNPSSWGLPVADLEGECVVDQHFQQHKIIFDTTFCGEWAGNPYVWNSTVDSCAVDTGHATCDAYVAENPAAFREAYWSINYVRVYQLVNPAFPNQEPQYIASLLTTTSTDQPPSSSTPAPTPTHSLCPTYNFTTIQSGGMTYEIECDYDLPGPDIAPPYANYQIHSFEDCVAGCTFWNTVNGTNLCGGVAYDASVPFCYFKKYIDQAPKYRSGFAGARLMYYGYPQITDDPRSQLAASTAAFTETIPTPQYYRPNTLGSSSSTTVISFSTTSILFPTIVPPPLGTATNETVRPTIEPGVPTVSYSGTARVPVTNVTSTNQPGPRTSRSIILSTLGQSYTASAITGSTSELNEADPSDHGSFASRTSASASSILVTAVSHTLSASSSDLPGPTAIASFRYAGCKAIDRDSDLLILDGSSSNMTLKSCISACDSSFYAAVSGSNCYCITSPDVDVQFLSYPDASCDSPCPGDPTQNCGGQISNNTIFKEKRQGSTSSNLILVTIYYNTAPNSTVTTTITETRTQTRTLVDVSSSTPTTKAAAHPINYTVTGTTSMTVMAISTAWYDYCAVCPGHVTKHTTTITVSCPVTNLQHASGASAITIPMMTTTRQCKCGTGGSRSQLTVTIPCETGLAKMLDDMQNTAASHSTLDTTSQSVTVVTVLPVAAPTANGTIANATVSTPSAPHLSSMNQSGLVPTVFAGMSTRCRASFLQAVVAAVAVAAILAFF